MNRLSQKEKSVTNPAPCRRPRPILMIPLRRCGSHALRLRLNFSEQFYSPYPLHIAEFVPLVPLYGDLDDDDAYFKLIVDVVGLQTVSMVKWPDMVFDPIDIFESLRDQPRSVHRIVWEMLLRAGEQHNAHVVMDKSLDSVYYADELMNLFPDMLFLNVVRDPRAQVASMNRAIIHDFDTMLNAKAWVDAHRVACALMKQHPERVLTIRYEDFLSKEEETLEKVCAFFGIEFLPQMLDVSCSSEALRISERSALWESNCFPPIAANADKFRKQLSLRDIEVIETLAHEYMHMYGYALMTGAQSSICEADFKAAKLRSEDKKRTAWRELKTNDYRDYVLRRFRANFLAGVGASFKPKPAVASKAASKSALQPA